MLTIEAFYLPSHDKNSLVIFDYEIDSFINSAEDYRRMSSKFLSDVSGFGISIPYPTELIAHMDERNIDQLLIDTEFFAEKSFFILVDQTDEYINVENDGKYLLCGSNGHMTVFKSPDGFILDVVDAKKASSMFEKISFNSMVHAN